MKTKPRRKVKRKVKREYKTRKAPPWMTGEIRCRDCVHFDPDTGMDDLGRCVLLKVYREPEEWCERARRTKEEKS